MTAASQAQAVHKLTKSFAGKLSGRERGADRRVRRNCIDENESAAQPWDRNRFSSSRERIATTESLVSIAKDLQAEADEKFPYGRVRQLEQERAIASAALDELMRAEPVDRPVGRPAALRLELERIDTLLAEHAAAITRTDVDVYEALFGFLCFNNTGRWFPSWEKIAAAARCCERSVGRALARLKHHGLLAWIPRSRREPSSDGRRGQTSHAYFLDLRRKMADRLYHRFLQLRARRMKRMAGHAEPKTQAPPPALAPAPPADRHVSDLRRSVSSLGSSILARDGHLG